MSNIVALDLSLSNTGIAVFTDDANCISLFSVATKSEMITQKRLEIIATAMKKLKKDFKPLVVVIEQGFTRFNTSTQQLFRVHGVVNYIFHDIEQIYFHSTSVRKTVLGAGNLKKEDSRIFVSKNYPEVIFSDLDQVDAFVLGLCYFKNKKEKNEVAY